MLLVYKNTPLSLRVPLLLCRSSLKKNADVIHEELTPCMSNILKPGFLSIDTTEFNLSKIISKALYMNNDE